MRWQESWPVTCTGSLPTSVLASCDIPEHIGTFAPYAWTVRILSGEVFEAERRAALRSVGRMTADNADGMVLDIDYKLDEVLLDAAIRWRGGDDSLITVTSAFTGDPQQLADRVMECLDDVAYDADRAIASLTVTTSSVAIAFATWSSTVGLATIQIQADQRGS
jgi:hypothetical protein